MNVKTVKLTPFSYKEGNGFAESFREKPALECVGYEVEGDTLYDGRTLCFGLVGGKQIELPLKGKNASVFCLDSVYGRRVVYTAEVEEGHLVYIAKEGGDGFEDSGIMLTARPIFAEVKKDGLPALGILDPGGVLYKYDGESFESFECPEGGVGLAYLRDSSVVVTPLGAYVVESTNAVGQIGYLGEMTFDAGFVAGGACLAADEIAVASVDGLIMLKIGRANTPYIVDSYRGTEKLFPKTLCRGAEGVVCLTKKGVMTFCDGVLEYSHADAVCDVVEAEFACVGERGYEVGVFRKRGDNARKRALISFETDRYSVVEGDVSSVWWGGVGDCYAVSEGYKFLGSFYGRPISPSFKRTYRFQPTNFGVSGQKTITELSVAATSPVRVVVKGEGRSRTFVLKGRGLKKYIRPYMRGEIFNISLCSYGVGGFISAPTVKFEV